VALTYLNTTGEDMAQPGFAISHSLERDISEQYLDNSRLKGLR